MKSLKINYFENGDFMRSIAMISVILLHVFSNNEAPNQTDNQLAWWFVNVIGIGLRWCVPLFVMLSGALLIRPEEEVSTSRFLKKRFLRIGIPLIVWSIIYVWYLYTQSYMLNNSRDYLQFALVCIILFFKGTPYYHLYFLFILSGLYLITPILKRYIVNSTPKNQLYFIGLCLSLSSISTLFDQWIRHIQHFGTLNSFNFFVPYIGYYVAGYTLRGFKLNPLQKKAALFALFVSIFIGSVGTFYLMKWYGSSPKGMIFHDYLAPTVIVQTISFFLLINSTNTISIRKNIFIRRLSGASFGVYLIHPIVISFFEKLIQNNLFFESKLLTSFLLKVPFTVIISWCIVEILMIIPILRVSVGFIREKEK